MDFLKKNYLRMIIAFVLLCGTVASILAISFYRSNYSSIENFISTAMGAPETKDSKFACAYLLTYITALIFFVASLAAVIMNMFETMKRQKFVAAISTLSLGIVTTVLMTIAIAFTISSDTTQKVLDMMCGKSQYSTIPTLSSSLKPVAKYAFFSRLFELVTLLIVLGLLPLLSGVKKLLKYGRASA